MFLSHNLILQCQKILPVYKRSVNGGPIICLCTVGQSSFALFSKFCFIFILCSCCTFFMLHSFHVLLLSWCIFPVFYSFHYTLFLCCTYFMLHTFHVFFSMLHYFYTALFVCTLFMFRLLSVALSLAIFLEQVISRKIGSDRLFFMYCVKCVI